MILNPTVGDFLKKLAELRKEQSKVAEDLAAILFNNEYVIKSFVMDDSIAEILKEKENKHQFLIINLNRDFLDNYLKIYDDSFPQFTLIPDERAFRRTISDHKIIFEDNFHKKTRNIDYIERTDEFFSDNHLYFKDEHYIGFSDYSIVGKEYNESGFAPVAVAIHIVYLDKTNALRIHHFVSNTNDGIDDPGGKFGEALEKLVFWCDEFNVPNTLGLEGFYDCYKSGKYPGLGTVKKYSIMHHIELISNFLGGMY